MCHTSIIWKICLRGKCPRSQEYLIVLDSTGINWSWAEKNSGVDSLIEAERMTISSTHYHGSWKFWQPPAPAPKVHRPRNFRTQTAILPGNDLSLTFTVLALLFWSCTDMKLIVPGCILEIGIINCITVRCPEFKKSRLSWIQVN